MKRIKKFTLGPIIFHSEDEAVFYDDWRIIQITLKKHQGRTEWSNKDITPEEPVSRRDFVTKYSQKEWFVRVTPGWELYNNFLDKATYFYEKVTKETLQRFNNYDCKVEISWVTCKGRIYYNRNKDYVNFRYNISGKIPIKEEDFDWERWIFIPGSSKEDFNSETFKNFTFYKN
jgi:hypothetical protein